MTRNLRLAAVHSLSKFIGMRSPEDLAWSSDIRAVPFKRTQKSSLIYLDKPEVDSLLKTPDLQTSQGRRDYALLLFLYNTGARADEAARLTISDITWGSSPSVRIVGQGNKMRVCPLWKRTADHHDGDDDGNDAVAERGNAFGAHTFGACVPAVFRVHRPSSQP